MCSQHGCSSIKPFAVNIEKQLAETDDEIAGYDVLQRFRAEPGVRKLANLTQLTVLDKAELKTISILPLGNPN